MIDIDRVLVPTDFSECSWKAMKYGCEFSERFEAELHLLHVVEDTVPLLAEPELATVPLVEVAVEQERCAREKLAVRPDADWSATHRVVRAVRRGNAFLEIARYAQEQDVSVIILGTHGRTGLEHLLLGSVAEKVVRKAPCPVLIVRDPEHDFIHP
ncbi:MAG: universal stress protein UspA [Planctomycetaceae bacterium]|nr:universal stress protein UspA [Planctomycetaceae bacterium]